MPYPPDAPVDLHVLLPGALRFGTAPRHWRTLLGSCVAVTLWHPQRHCAGMCHFVLPERRQPEPGVIDGRYGREALDFLHREVLRHGTRPAEYRAQVYGGADTMPHGRALPYSIGARNIELALTMLDALGYGLHEIDVGERAARTVQLDLMTGAVALQRHARHVPHAHAVRSRSADAPGLGRHTGRP